MAEKYYRIVGAKSDRFIVDFNGEHLFCYSRKKNKKDELLVGDWVSLDGDVILSAKKRDNRLIRPAIANVNQVIFLISPLPRPDLFLLDKQIVNCLAANIEVVICQNKNDIYSPQLFDDLLRQYIGHEVISISAALGEGLNQLTGLLSGKLTCLAGQSAVGKSTLIAKLTGSDIKTGELSAVGRGRNTTTATQLYKVGGGLLADTPGFNMLDIHNVEYDKLHLYYPEFLDRGCKYRGCTHTTEPSCAVVEAVSGGQINQERYSRYVELFNQLKDAFNKKF